MNSNIIDISSLDATPSISLGGGGDKNQGIRFDDGLDLLVNKKKIGDSSSRVSTPPVRMDDIQNLEQELHNLDGGLGRSFDSSSKLNISDDLDSKPSGGLFENLSSVGGGNSSSNSGGGGLFDMNLGLGTSTADLHDNSKTWDGYGKIASSSNAPLSSFQMTPAKQQSQPQKSDRVEQIKYWKKLEGLKRHGTELSREYSADSPLNEMKYEYDSIISERKRDVSIKFQQSVFTTLVTGIQMTSSKLNYVNLDGLSEQVTENINDYDDIFSELHEMTSDYGTVHPLLRMAMQLGGSMVMVHMTNSMFKSSTAPGLEDMLKQDPEFMRQFQSATLNAMSQNNPGTANFLRSTNGIPPQQYQQPQAQRPQPQQNPPASASGGDYRPMPAFNVARGNGPPPPIKTRGGDSPPSNRDRGGNKVASRPDLARSFPTATSTGPSGSVGLDGPAKSSAPGAPKTVRPDMKGPGDISDIIGKMDPPKTARNTSERNSGRNTPSGSAREIKGIKPLRKKREKMGDMSMDM